MPKGGRGDVGGFVASSCTIRARFLDRSSGDTLYWHLLESETLFHPRSEITEAIRGRKVFNATKGQLSGQIQRHRIWADVLFDEYSK